MEITNAGGATQQNFSVGYSINGVASAPETFTDSIVSGASATYTFAAPVNLSAAGNYNIVVYTGLVGDFDNTNDTLRTSVVSVGSASALPYAESFETGNGGWILSGDNVWELGVPAGALIDTASDGTQAWVTDLDANYADAKTSFVNSPCFDFTGITNPHIDLDIWYDIETSWDGAVLQSSIDGGLTWQIVGSVGDPLNWYNDGAIDALAGIEPSVQAMS